MSDRILLATALAFAALLIGILLLYGYGRDQSIYTAVSDAIARGGAPYRDAWDFKPPMIFFVYAAASSLFGAGHHSVRIVEAVGLVSLVLAYALFSRRHIGDARPGLLGGALAVSACVQLEFWNTAQPESFGAIATAWALVCASYEPAGVAPWRQRAAWAGAGALFTFAALLKPPLGGGFVVSLVWVWVRRAGHGERLRAGIEPAAAFTVGALPVLAATALFFVARDAWGDLLEMFFVFIPAYVALEFSWTALPRLLERATQNAIYGYSTYVPVGLALLLVLPRSGSGAVRGTTLVAGIAVVQILGIALAAKFFAYHFAAALALLALLAGWGIWKLWLRVHRNAVWSALVMLCLLLLHDAHPLKPTRGDLTFLERSRARLEAIGDETRVSRERLESASDFRLRSIHAAGDWLAEHTLPGEPIFVWGFEPLIYLLADRPPASRYVYNVAQRIDWPRRDAARQRLLEDLERTPPAAVVVAHRDRQFGATGNTRTSKQEIDTFPEFRDWLGIHYRKAGSVANFSFFARNTPSADERRPDVLLLSIDTLRPDYLSTNGYDRKTSPVLDALIDEGFYFEQTVSPIAHTTPAIASLLTGSYPHTTGVRKLTDGLRAEISTLPEILKGAGYQTRAVVTNQMLHRRTRLDRGFGDYELAADHRRAEDTTDAAVRQLAEVGSDLPYFAWVHYIDPHVPYHPTPLLAEEMDPGYSGRYAKHFGWNRTEDEHRRRQRHYPEDLPKAVAVHRNPLSDDENRHIRRLYAGDIRATDLAIARLIEAFRARSGKDLLIIFTSDHGESLGEHDFYFDHGEYVYNAETRVPLAFILPKDHPLHGKGRCPGWVSLVDVVPTVLDLLGLEAAAPPGPQIEGRSLTACMRGEAITDEPVFLESGHSQNFAMVRGRQRNDVAGRFRAVIDGDWKLIWTPFRDGPEAWQLYDLAQDPDEITNLYHPEHPEVASLEGALSRWLRRQRAEERDQPVGEEDMRALRSLGYIE